MEEKTNVPALLDLLFDDAAEAAQRGASSRLKRWAAAFDAWLVELRQNFKPSTRKYALLAWRRLLRQQQKMPWELAPADIHLHVTWMQGQGYSSLTIAAALGYLAKFYRWCDRRRIDPECVAGFNPAAAVPRPKVIRYAGSVLLSRAEIDALLGYMQRDASPLGRRDYAFVLARLRLGVPLSELKTLRWGQLEPDGEGVWVQWRPGAPKQPLPQEVWQAVQAALVASGRLAGIQPADYVFAPLAKPGKAHTGSRAEDWQSRRSLSNRRLLKNLKLYGRRVGLSDEKLTLRSLRLSAVRLRLDEGASIEQMQAFMDSRNAASSTKYCLGRLPRLPPGEENQAKGDEGQKPLPYRSGRPRQPGEGITHGLYARSRDSQAVAAVLAEDIHGIDEVIAGMRRLERGLLEKMAEPHTSQELAQLSDAYTLTASRLATLMTIEKELSKQGEADSWADDLLETLDQAALEQGEKPISDAVRAAARGESASGGDPDRAAARQLTEEIANIRRILRKTLALAQEASSVQEYIKLVEIYSMASNRLLRMLRMEVAQVDQLEAFLREGIDRAIRQNAQEMGLG